MKITVYRILDGNKLIQIYQAIVLTKEERQRVIDNISPEHFYTEE